jgi:hypothetical protein
VGRPVADLQPTRQHLDRFQQRQIQRPDAVEEVMIPSALSHVGDDRLIKTMARPPSSTSSVFGNGFLLRCGTRSGGRGIHVIVPVDEIKSLGAERDELQGELLRTPGTVCWVISDILRQQHYDPDFPEGRLNGWMKVSSRSSIGLWVSAARTMRTTMSRWTRRIVERHFVWKSAERTRSGSIVC